MKRLLFPFLLLLMLQSLIAQEPPSFPSYRHTLGLRLGLSHVAMLDRNTSSLIYQGNLPSIGFDYQSFTERGYFDARLKLGRGSFSSKAFPDRHIQFINKDVHGEVDSVSVPMRGTSTVAKFEVGYLRKLNPGRPMEWAAGAFLSDEAFYQEGFVTPGIMNVASVSPAARATWWGDNQMISFTVSVPLVAFTSRNTWNNAVSQPDGNKIKGFFGQGSHFESLKLHQQIRFSAGYERKLGNRLLAGLQYDLTAIKNTSPRTLRLAQQDVSLCFQFIY